MSSFFHPPKDLPTTVFARLPAEWQTAGPDNEWIRGQPGGTPPGSLLEGSDSKWPLRGMGFALA